MMLSSLDFIECVMNVSEGRDAERIRSIASQVETVPDRTSSTVHRIRITIGPCFRLLAAASPFEESRWQLSARQLKKN